MPTLLFQSLRNVAGVVQFIPLFSSQYWLLDGGHTGIKHWY